MPNITEQAPDYQSLLPLLNNGRGNQRASKPYWRALASRWLFVLAALIMIFVGALYADFIELPRLVKAVGVGPVSGPPQLLANTLESQSGDTSLSLPTIKALGRLMPLDDIAVVAPPFGSGDARVAKWLVREGEQITAGAVIAELDSLAQLQSALQIATANQEVAAARVAQIENQIGAALHELVAQHQSAEDAADFASTDFQRISELHRRKLLSHKDYEQAELNLATKNHAREQIQAQLNRVTGGRQQADIQLAVSQYQLANAEFARATIELAKAYVHAPKSGRILRVNTRVGERPSEAGIAILGNTDQMQAELEIYQTDIRHIALGAKVSLTSPAIEAPFYGAIVRIGLEVLRQEIVGSSPASNLDARIVRIVVDLDQESSVRAQTLTGLAVTAAIERAHR